MKEIAGIVLYVTSRTQKDETRVYNANKAVKTAPVVSGSKSMRR